MKKRKTQGTILLLRDGWIVDGIWTFKTFDELTKKRAEADAEAESNRRKYQGTWRVSVIWNDNVKRSLKSYCRAVGIG